MGRSKYSQNVNFNITCQKGDCKYDISTIAFYSNWMRLDDKNLILIHLLNG